MTERRIASQTSAGHEPLRVAYLTNAYPKVSHSFIRREILSLEQLGVEILRISIRRTYEHLPDPDDQQEARKTIALVGSPGTIGVLIGSTFKALVKWPLAFLKTLRVAVASGGGSSAGHLRHLAYFAEACVVADLLQRAGVKHLHVHFGTNPAAVARLVKVLTGIPYSFTIHGPDEFDDPRGLKLREKVSDAAFVVAISSFGRGQVMRWADAEDWNRIKVVRCGLDSKFLSSPIAQPPPTNRFVCVARLSGQKGIPLLLEAAALVRSRGHDFELRIAGDGELRDDVEAMIGRLELGDCVHLLGWQNADQVMAELEGCRAFVLPSFAEGLPVVIMEALALGRPVIATAIAGIPELVDDGCGWLINSGSVDDLARAMIEALSASAETLQEMGKVGRARVTEQHDSLANAGQLLQLIRQQSASS